MAIGGLAVTLELDGAGNYITTIERAADSTKNFATQATMTAAAANKLSLEMGRTVNPFREMNMALNTAARQHRETGQATEFHIGSLSKLVIVMGQAQAAFNILKGATYDWGQQIIQVNAKMESMMLLLKGVSTATTEAGRSAEALGDFNMLMDKASSSPFSLSRITDSFVKLKGAGIEPAGKALQSIIDATAHFGGNDQVLQRVSLALQEMSGKGVVSMQELRRQLGDAIPGAMKAMASSMNLTEGQLVSLVRTGTLESKNAISQMSAELDRLYGGAAAAKLNTYAGQLSLMTTNFQKLALVAGGRDGEGGYGEGSFFKNVTDQLKEFNRYLKTPEVTAFAISVNNALNSVVNGLVTAAKFFRDWGMQIIAVTATIVGMTAAYKLLNAVMLANAALKAPSYFSKLMEEQPALEFLINSFTKLRGVSTVAFTGIVGSIGNFMAASRAFVGITPAMTSGLTGLTAAAVEGAAGLTSLTIGFAAIALPVAAIAGLALIIAKLVQVENHGQLAADALKRVAQGDLTEDNERKARAEEKAIDDRYNALIAYRDKLQDVKSGKTKSVLPQEYEKTLSASAITAPKVQGNSFLPLEYGGGDAGEIAITSQNINDDPVVKHLQQVNDAINKIGEERRRALATVDGIAPAKSKVTSDQIFDDIQKQINNDMQARRNEYRDRDNALQGIRQQYAGNHDTFSTQVIGSVNSAVADNRSSVYQTELGKYDAQIKDQQEKLKAALDAGQKDVADYTQGTLEKLNKARGDIQTAMNDAAQNAGKVVLNTAEKNYDHAVNTAQTLLTRLQANVAGLESELDGGSMSLGKLQEQLNDPKKWGAIPQELKDQLIEFAKRSDDASKKLKDFKEAASAQKKIDLGLDKANADLERWNAAVSDPNATEAQRNFSTFQASMQVALRASAEAFRNGSITAAQYGQAITDATNATRTAAAAGIMEQVAQRIKEGQAAYEASLSPEKRAKVVADRRKKEDSDLGSSLNEQLQNGAITQDQFDKATAQLKEATQKRQSIPYSAGAAGRGAARKDENAVDSLSSKIAQLKAEIAGTNPELAKYDDLISNGKYAGRAGEISKEAAEYGKLKDVLKQVQAARQAEGTLEGNAKDASYAQKDMEDLIAATNQRGKLLGIERELYDIRRRANKELNTVTKGEGNNPATGAAKIAEARANEQKVIDGNTNAALLKRQLDLASETESVKQAVDTSLAARRDAGLKRIEFDEQADQRSLASSTLTEQQKADFETQLAQNVAAKKLQLERQTETGLDKWIRESSDLQTNLENLAGQGVTQLQDAFTSFAENGKFSFTDLANWAIKELTRITLSSAFAQLLKAGGVSGGSGGGINFSGIISAIGGAFGGGAKGGGGAAPSDATDPFAGAGMSVPANHSGGIVGSEKTFSRILSSAHFANAPKFHTGGVLNSNEVPSILQKGEGVFTAGQMSAIGRMNHDYTATGGALADMSAAVSRLAASPSVPSSFAPQPNYDPSDRVQGASAQSGAAPPMTVNMNNQTGSPMGATAASPRFDGEQWVVDIVLKHANQPGALRTSLQGMNGGR